ncbi:MAG: DUF1569 domain-containing protein [Gemmatimonadaceae bacterium]
MPSMFEKSTRDQICRRIARLSPETERLWGTMRVDQMVCHLSDQLRLALGQISSQPVPGPLHNAFGRRLAIDFLPWPKGKIKGPREAFTTRPRNWHADVRTLEQLLDQFAALQSQRKWPEHPLFGRMSGPLWGRLTCKHFDHHLRQFGV